jgi:hypothetical protein
VSGRTESKFSAVGRTIVATTTVGTTMAAFCDRSLGIGYVGGSALLSTLLMPVWACNGCELPQDGAISLLRPVGICLGLPGLTPPLGLGT